MTDIQNILEEAGRTQSALEWEGTFEEYLRIVTAEPAVARLSHTRLYDMVRSAGVVPGLEGVPRYGLFAGEIFGQDRPLDRLVQHLRVAAGNLESRNRILLLVGPAGSGKTSILDLLKRGLERYTSTRGGAIYAIVGCPLHEEPLHLIPTEQRRQLAQECGLHVEGDLCPQCQDNLRHEYGGVIGNVKIRQVILGGSRGVGMGSYTGSCGEDRGIPALPSNEGEPHSYGGHVLEPGRHVGLDGELQSANRGIMELVDMFTSDDRLPAVLRAVTQQQRVRLRYHGPASVDEVIVARSDPADYTAFVKSGRGSALQDSLVVIKVPYNLRVSDEQKLYAYKLSEGRSGHHDMAPLTLRVAAVLSVLSRLQPGRRGIALRRVSLLEKLRMYDGRVLPPHSAADVEYLKDACPGEGMSGISPRYAINRLADARFREEGCLKPSKALESLVEGLDERAGMTSKERARVGSLAKAAIWEYEDLAVSEVQRAATEGFRVRAGQLLQSYLREATRYCDELNARSSHAAVPDESLMRRVEGALGVADDDRPRFRREVSRSYDFQVQAYGPSAVGLNSIPALRVAVENTLFPGKSELRLTLDPHSADPERTSARRLIARRLVLEYGYCSECADDLLDFSWRTLTGKKAITAREGRVRWT